MLAQSTDLIYYYHNDIMHLDVEHLPTDWYSFERRIPTKKEGAADNGFEYFTAVHPCMHERLDVILIRRLEGSNIHV